MATGLTFDAKHQECLVGAAYPIAERPGNRPTTRPEHPLRVLADVRRA